jgi:hypothetical protein
MKRLSAGAVLTAALIVALSLGGASAQATTYSACSTMRCRSIVQGTFLQGTAPLDWTAAQWDSELKNMTAVNMRELVLQWSLQVDDNRAFYPSSIPGYAQAVSQGGLPVDVVGNTLANAKAHGMRVWLGLQIDQAWFTNNNDPNYLNLQAPLAERVADELWARYGSFATTIKGWYLPFEVTNYDFTTPSSQSNLQNFFQQVVTYLHNHDGDLPVMTAPFYSDGTGLSPSGWTSLWTGVLKAAPFDVIALQDGVGDNHVDVSTPAATAGRLRAWFSATRAAITAAQSRTALWDDADMYGIDGWPISTRQLVDDMNAVAPYVSRIVGFSFSSQFSPLHWGGNTLFYDPYKTYVTTGVVPSGAPTAPGGLLATSPLALTANLSWLPSVSTSGAGIAGYRVYRDPAATGGTMTLITTLHGPTMLSFTDPQRTAGANYSYHVVAYDAAGNVSAPAAATLTISGNTYVNNAAWNQSYSWVSGLAQPDLARTPLYADAAGQHKLTDGTFATTDPQDGKWLGVQNSAKARVELSLGTTQTVHQITTDWLQQNSWGIELPAQVSYYYLSNGLWLPIADITQPNVDRNSVTTQTYTVTDLNIVTNQIAVVAWGFPPGTTGTWTPWNFIDEAQVFTS